jgi:hypothetical protein
MPTVWEVPDEVYGSDRTIHRIYQHWCRVGVFERMWAMVHCCGFAACRPRRRNVAY